MRFKSIATGATFAASLILATLPVKAQELPEGYPADYSDLIAKAKKEGRVSLYAATDEEQATALLTAFTQKYGIQVDYTDMGTNNAYSRTIAEAEANQTGSDIIWSSAMDLQLKLAVDGYTETYESPEIKNLPEWANYKNMVYATTVEPVGTIYNTNSFPDDSFPKTRAALIAYIQNHRKELSNKIATFDPEKSGVGFVIQTNDGRSSESFWQLAKAMGEAKVKSYSATGTMRETVVSGENVMAVNVIGSYALNWIKNTPNLGVAFGTDYTAAFSRPAIIPRGAPHPHAARLFLDFMLSKDGQTAIAEKGLPSIRTDIEGYLDLDSLNDMVGGNLQPIALDDALLEYLKPQNRVKFFREWNAAVK
ncbi:ABC transporter substrate-binding protein [Bartonella tamiae]|uniref:ABC transporter substrate-binding protein n=1 Tax=Bartonella tamiae TaxID=373638 RepID=UPI00026E7397|nr:ABC transporter substrate-binding protein [Bartonella tamiae]EJF95531.1 hypothetical protein MEG_00021 [Bartonella tamiae Th307]